MLKPVYEIKYLNNYTLKYYGTIIQYILLRTKKYMYFN